ncbi:hypothetical protein PAXINDRAFT_20076, partial [Paxillus involutus ATCC 200175]
LRNLSISEDSQFFIAINPHIAYPLNSRPPSPSAKGIFRTPSDPVSGFSDPFSPAVPGAFAHSTPQRTFDRTTAPSPFSSPLTPLPSSAPSSPLPPLTALIRPLDSPLCSSPLPVSPQPQPDITFPHISPSNANPPQRQILAEAAQINDEAAQIKVAIRYTDLNEAEVWQTLTAASGGDWDAFVVAVKDLYPGCEGADRYCRADLQYLVQDYHAKAMRSQDELGEYRRKFMKISTPLIANKKLADTEWDAFFLDGFPRVIADRVRHRLSIIRADLHPDKAYPMEDVMDAAKFLLTGAALCELLANPQEGRDHSRQQGLSPAPRQPSGVVVKQEYSLQAQQAAQRHPGECEHVIAYLQAGKIIRGPNG